MKLTPSEKKALAKFGEDTAVNAYSYNMDGEGPSTIAVYLDASFHEANSLINAGRKIDHARAAASMNAIRHDAELIRLFDEELAPLESEEEHAISHEQFKRLDDIRDDMAEVKRRINARLKAIHHHPLYFV